MAEIKRMIEETAAWRAEHVAAAKAGQKGRWVDAAACAVREKALREALRAIEKD